MSTPTGLNIGVVGLPEAVGPLGDLFDVITAPTAAGAADAIVAALDANPSGRFPVVVATTGEDGWGRILDRLTSRAWVVVVADPAHGTDVPSDLPVLDVPVTLAALLGACGAPDAMIPDGAGEVIVASGAPPAPVVPAGWGLPPTRPAPAPPEQAHDRASEQVYDRIAAASETTGAGDAPARKPPAPPRFVEPAPFDSPAPPTRPAPGPDRPAGPAPAGPPAAGPGPAPSPAGRPDPDPGGLFDPAGGEEPEDDSVFDDPAADRLSMGEVVIVFSAKGGAGKSTMSQALAATASAAGLKTVLVDANSGQGDQRTLLRVANAGLPTVYEALNRPARAAFCSPADVNAARARFPTLERVSWVNVFAPPEDLAAKVGPAVYRRVIDHALAHADLVVVDTQILEAKDDSGMLTGLLAPLLRERAWGVGVTDASSMGIANLMGRLAWMSRAGVARDRLMTLVNKKPSSIDLAVDKLAARLERWSHFMGVTPEDHDVAKWSSAGHVLADVPALANMSERILNRVVGTPIRSAPPGGGVSTAPDGTMTGSRGGFLARVFGRGR